MASHDILISALVLCILAYGLMEVDHFFPVRHKFFNGKGFIDYEAYEVESEGYYFYYRTPNGKRENITFILIVSQFIQVGKFI